MEKFDRDGNFIAKWGSKGGGTGQFEFPQGVAVDGFGNVYVADAGNNRVQIFNVDGRFLLQLGSKGNDDGQFEFPGAIAVDSIGKVYVADTNNHRVQVFAPVQ